ncbi:enoyl-CoA hydratase-related protein [Nakamurella lactea]|uniref:enoyl-CoA hydratase-related protein n=1 Tax=Nakamurella lactea TaxID=459515 RepID=UPI0004144CA4|nr:enoyl-CoA hydratase-related protein [Nakamurella lactea]
MTYDSLDWRLDEDGVGLLTLDRPDRLNAMNWQVAEEIETFFRTDALSDEVRAIVVTGAGRAFSAGADLDAAEQVFAYDRSLLEILDKFRERYDQPPYQQKVRDGGGRMTLAINAVPKPVIAAINGPAVGFGATMTLAMDARLMSSAARIGFVFGRIGLVPEAASSWFLPRIVGLARSLELVYTADIIDASLALQYGLVRSVHEPDRLVEEAMIFARRCTSDRSPYATGLTKRLVYHGAGAGDPLEAHLSDSLATYWASLVDAQEGIAAFQEHRRPRFTGRASDIPDLF